MFLSSLFVIGSSAAPANKCDDSDDFWCNDGTCITIEELCNKDSVNSCFDDDEYLTKICSLSVKADETWIDRAEASIIHSSSSVTWSLVLFWLIIAVIYYKMIAKAVAVYRERKTHKKSDMHTVIDLNGGLIKESDSDEVRFEDFSDESFSNTQISLQAKQTDDQQFSRAQCFIYGILRFLLTFLSFLVVFFLFLFYLLVLLVGNVYTLHWTGNGFIL